MGSERNKACLKRATCCRRTCLFFFSSLNLSAFVLPSILQRSETIDRGNHNKDTRNIYYSTL